jgi:hypothetical protein
MSHKDFNQSTVDMLCEFLGDNTRNYSEKKPLAAYSHDTN